MFWIVVSRPFLWIELENMYHTDNFHSNSGLQGFYSPSSILPLYFLSSLFKNLVFYDTHKIIRFIPQYTPNSLGVTIPTLPPPIQLLKTVWLFASSIYP